MYYIYSYIIYFIALLLLLYVYIYMSKTIYKTFSLKIFLFIILLYFKQACPIYIE